MSQPPLNSEKSVQNRFKAVDIPKQEPCVRVNNFKEVVIGYTEDQALAEASRCLHCSNAQCVKGCPVGIDIPEFIKCITQKNYDAAIAKIKEKNSLPAICGRVCPQEEQCQKISYIAFEASNGYWIAFFAKYTELLTLLFLRTNTSTNGG